ncbi:MAG: cytochrome P460 family protein [Rubrivivax sp.]|nr:cytochrome P460 family protein [Pyrinomonadaceae bacterium]
MPQIRTSRGSTKISLEGSSVYSEPSRNRSSKKKEAHEGDALAFNVVYFNETARAAMSGERPAKFPAGSIIVSEKLLKPDDAPPELLAVMVKRAAGFSPKAGDWEFLVVNGALTEVRERQKKGHCAECHASQRENDFVFPLAPSK